MQNNEVGNVKLEAAQHLQNIGNVVVSHEQQIAELQYERATCSSSTMFGGDDRGLGRVPKHAKSPMQHAAEGEFGVFYDSQSRNNANRPIGTGNDPAFCK